VDLNQVKLQLREVQQQRRRFEPQLTLLRDTLTDFIVDNFVNGARALNDAVLSGDPGQIEGFMRGANSLVLGHMDARTRPDRQEQMADFVSWYRRNYRRTQDPYLFAAEAYVRILSGQLFMEGNHRTGNLVANYILMQHGLPPFFLDLDNAVEYFNLSSEIKYGGLYKWSRAYARRQYALEVKKLFVKYPFRGSLALEPEQGAAGRVVVSRLERKMNRVKTAREHLQVLAGLPGVRLSPGRAVTIVQDLFENRLRLADRNAEVLGQDKQGREQVLAVVDASLARILGLPHRLLGQPGPAPLPAARYGSARITGETDVPDWVEIPNIRNAGQRLRLQVANHDRKDSKTELMYAAEDLPGGGGATVAFALLPDRLQLQYVQVSGPLAEQGWAASLSEWVLALAQRLYPDNPQPLEVDQLINPAMLNLALDLFDPASLEALPQGNVRWRRLSDPAFDLYARCGPLRLLGGDTNVIRIQRQGESYQVTSQPADLTVALDGPRVDIRRTGTGERVQDYRYRAPFNLRGVARASRFSETGAEQVFAGQKPRPPRTQPRRPAQLARLEVAAETFGYAQDPLVSGLIRGLRAAHARHGYAILEEGGRSMPFERRLDLHKGRRFQAGEVAVTVFANQDTKHEEHIAVITNRAGEIIGHAGIQRDNEKASLGIFGIRIFPPYLNQGYGRQILMLIMKIMATPGLLYAQTNLEQLDFRQGPGAEGTAEWEGTKRFLTQAGFDATPGGIIMTFTLRPAAPQAEPLSAQTIRYDSPGFPRGTDIPATVELGNVRTPANRSSCVCGTTTARTARARSSTFGRKAGSP
jgi:RimJ/RimL family protein N-acetyltransferase